MSTSTPDARGLQQRGVSGHGPRGHRAVRAAAEIFPGEAESLF